MPNRRIGAGSAASTLDLGAIVPMGRLSPISARQLVTCRALDISAALADTVYYCGFCNISVALTL